MAILDKVLAVGGAVRDKWNETFSLSEEGLADDGDGGDDAADLVAPLDVAGAYAALMLPETATLAEVREAHRNLSRAWHPILRRDGPDSDAQKATDRLLESLELLEEALLPLASGGAGAPPPASKRKRATARKRRAGSAKG